MTYEIRNIRTNQVIVTCNTLNSASKVWNKLTMKYGNFFVIRKVVK